jgi:hypothetical protein
MTDDENGRRDVAPLKVCRIPEDVGSRSAQIPKKSGELPRMFQEMSATFELSSLVRFSHRL